MSTQVHAVQIDGIPTPCQCELGYHHLADGWPLAGLGPHPFCVGACKVWGTPTEEFDFVLVSGRRINQRRILTGLMVVDVLGAGGEVECWDGDHGKACQLLGMVRREAWRKKRPAV